MADEITVTTGMKLSNELLKSSEPNTAAKFTQTTARSFNTTQDVGTSQESVSFGDVVPGFVRLINLDPTNFVEWGTVTGDLNCRLLANGGMAVFYMNSGETLYLKADTAECKVQIIAFNQ